MAEFPVIAICSSGTITGLLMHELTEFTMSFVMSDRNESDTVRTRAFNAGADRTTRQDSEVERMREHLRTLQEQETLFRGLSNRDQDTMVLLHSLPGGYLGRFINGGPYFYVRNRPAMKISSIAQTFLCEHSCELERTQAKLNELEEQEGTIPGW